MSTGSKDPAPFEHIDGSGGSAISPGESASGGQGDTSYLEIEDQLDSLDQRVTTLEVGIEDRMGTDTAVQVAKIEVLESIFRAVTIAIIGVAAVGLVLSLIARSVSFTFLFTIGLLFLRYAYRSAPSLFSDE